MPLKTWDLKSDWDAAYSFGAEGDVGRTDNTRAEVRLHYHRATKGGEVSLAHATALMAALGLIPPGPTVLIAGAGFGWTAEAMETLGFSTVVGIDISTYIQDNKGGTEDAEIDVEITAVGLDPTSGEGLDIKNRIVARGGGAGNRSRNSRGVLNENGNSNASRGRIKRALDLQGNERIGWIIIEAVLESLDDTEALDASSTANSYGDNIVHFVYTLRARQDVGFNWKTLEDWKTLIPGDTFVEAGSYRVL